MMLLFVHQIAEINRILRSGGVFVGTTFLRVNPSAPTIFRALEQVNFIFHLVIKFSPF